MAETRAAENKLKVFISYSRKDLTVARRIVAALEARGLAPKIDTRDLPNTAAALLIGVAVGSS